MIRSSFGGKGVTEMSSGLSTDERLQQLGNLGRNSKERQQSEVMTRNAGLLVSSVVKQIGLTIRMKNPVVPIVESLTWIVVARRSARNEWFSPKEFQRFLISMTETARRINKYTDDENREQSFVKYWLNFYLCRYFGDPNLPERDDWIVDNLFSGWLARLVSRALAQRDASFFYSLQKGSKLIWPELGEKAKEKALKKHKAAFSETHGPLGPAVREALHELSTVVFSSCSLKNGTKFLPSGSACSQASRREGGALSLYKQFHAPNPKGKMTESMEETHTQVAMSIMGVLPVYAQSLDSWRQREFDHAVEESLVGLGIDMKSPEFSPVLPRFQDVSGLRELPFAPCGVEESTPSAPSTQPKYRSLEMKVQAIPEPGKFRIITKGDGYLYSALQPLQGLMLDAWKRRPEATMKHQDLTEKVNAIHHNCGKALPLWCSGDYEAATDNIKREATIEAFRGLWRHPLYRLGLVSLSGGECEYPDRSRVQFLDGQPMGHPLSFPLLCVINMAVLHATCKKWVAASKSRQQRAARKCLSYLIIRNCLINGDDILFKAPDREFCELFGETAGEAGLKLSVGKNYVSSHSCMINSQMFVERDGKMIRKGYLNLKLVKGTNIKEGESAAFATQIGSEISKMVKLCPWTACTIPSCMGRWEKESKKFHTSFVPNWYLPVHLGGYGVDVSLSPSSWKVTRWQRKVAAHFVSDPRLALFRKAGQKIDFSLAPSSVANWRMVAGTYVPNRGESEDADDGWSARFALGARAGLSSFDLSDRVFLARLADKCGLAPMSAEALVHYWQVRFFAYETVPCPPLREITFDSLVGSRSHLAALSQQMGFSTVMAQNGVGQPSDSILPC